LSLTLCCTLLCYKYLSRNDRPDGSVKRYALDLARLYPPLPNCLTPHPRPSIITYFPLHDDPHSFNCVSNDYEGQAAAQLCDGDRSKLARTHAHNSIVFFLLPDEVCAVIAAVGMVLAGCNGSWVCQLPPGERVVNAYAREKLGVDISGPVVAISSLGSVLFGAVFTIILRVFFCYFGMYASLCHAQNCSDPSL
jgi:hypothetical protein